MLRWPSGCDGRPKARHDWVINDALIDEPFFRSFIKDLRAIASNEADSLNSRRLARAAADRLQDALDAAVAGNHALARELIEGVRPDGTVSRDTLKAILPKWARGTSILDALAGVVVPDADANPPSVTVHWEMVPRHLRSEAASLASELVDGFYPRPKGGRGRRENRSRETG